MTTTTAPSAPPAVPRASVLDAAVSAQAARRRADVALLEAAHRWALAHTVDDPRDAATWADGMALSSLFGERFVPLAGAGTPHVAEFAVVELSAALGVSHESALALTSDALDLVHRLPRLWRLVRALRVPAHLAREAAAASRDLDPAAVDHADRLLVWQPRRLNPHRIGVLVHEARLYADPDRARADHDEALATRRVEVRHDSGAPGASEVHMTLDTADAVALDTTLGAIADSMAALGHPGSLDVLRATGVGVLADPQRTLDLLAAAEVPATQRATSEAVATAEDDMFRPATPLAGAGGRARGRSGEATLVLHLSDHDLLQAVPGGTGAATHDTLGPLALARLESWLAGCARVIVRPVLDPHRIAPVDRHDPPAAMAEAVRLRDATCVFPGCARGSHRADLDHIAPYRDDGTTAQTSYDNLAPLCRRHHRAKTHGHFGYHRTSDGNYQWSLPSGRVAVTEPPVPRPRPPSD
ncbi:MAG: HNH endonuclease [Nocardioides sp.]|uniref:HNH endonuclease signature motif containing protein n=1 Tax=Nocardioides sp. TaxID=35761 RepID=UPI003F011FEB